jgi:cytochrome oxidase assembly protein ShyY1
LISINWKVTAFSALFCVVFINLGAWQLQRETEKRELLADQSLRDNERPIGLQDLPAVVHTGQPVTLRGHWDPQDYSLIDNRVLNGRVGFEILQTWFDVSLQQKVLVNRGFVPMLTSRTEAPRVPPVEEASSITGTIYQQQNRWAGSEAMSDGRILVQTAVAETLGGIRGESYFPYVVRLNISDPSALPRYWPVTTISPEKHLGYAIQWFLMALAIAVIWLVFTAKTQSESREPN